jgi:hypothetical protein
MMPSIVVRSSVTGRRDGLDCNFSPGRYGDQRLAGFHTEYLCTNPLFQLYNQSLPQDWSKLVSETGLPGVTIK